MPAFVDPPDFRSDQIGHVFMTLAGFSSIANLFSMLCATAFVQMLQRPFGSVDSFVARLDQILLVVANVLDYMGAVTLLAATLVAGFNRDNFDGFVQLYSIALVVFLSIAWGFTAVHLNETQTRRVVGFKEKYCDSDGQLKDAWLKTIYPSDDVPALLTGIGCEHLLHHFVRAGLGPEDSHLDAVLLLSRDDLVDMGVTKLPERLKLLAEFQRVRNI